MLSRSFIRFPIHVVVALARVYNMCVCVMRRRYIRNENNRNSMHLPCMLRILVYICKVLVSGSDEKKELHRHTIHITSGRFPIMSCNCYFSIIVKKNWTYEVRTVEMLNVDLRLFHMT